MGEGIGQKMEELVPEWGRRRDKWSSVHADRHCEAYRKKRLVILREFDALTTRLPSPVYFIPQTHNITEIKQVSELYSAL